ncbi:MAG: hypothetical protein IKT41_01305 [Clostridia bacterium]|nr:hypothetical protein [Clostridia bacterium]
MEKKYINAGRYKKVVTKHKNQRRSENIGRKIRHEQIKDKPTKYEAKKKKRIRKNNKILLFFTFIIVVLLMTAIVLRFNLKGENEGFFDFLKVKVEGEKIENLNIALVDKVDILEDNTKNIIITELNQYTTGVLLRIDDDYNITYELLKDIEKISNTEYILNISEKNTLNATVLKARLQSFQSENSKYYTNVKCIKEIEEIDSKQLKVILDSEDSMFIYKLQLPISFTSANSGLYTKNIVKNDSDKIVYISKDAKNSIPKSINVYRSSNEEEIIKLFKNEEINMFFTNNFSIGDKLGKYEYDIRSYRSGKCLFLFGNKESEIFSRKEVRQAIAYSVDRGRIKKDIYLNSGEEIDIPNIYSEVKYKYDIYSAQNTLLTNGYTLVNEVFQKIENGKKIKLSLDLLVNKEDETKLKVASYIKEDLKKVGIEINIVTSTLSGVNKKVNSGDYDLVLADISLNENPDISFLKNFVNVNENIDKKILEISETNNIEELVSKVGELETTLSNEVPCVGIHADVTYVVNQKNIGNFENISYLNVFKNILIEE